MRAAWVGLLALAVVACGQSASKKPAHEDVAAATGTGTGSAAKPAAGTAARDPDGVPKFMDHAPTVPAAQPPKLPLAKRINLPGGLEVRYLEKRDLPLVRFGLLVRLGAADAPPGVAYIAAKMLSEGAGKRGALALSAALQQIGAALSISVGRDYIEVDLEVLTRHLDAGLALLTDVLRRPRFEPAELNRLEQRLAARARARRARATSVAPLVFHKVVFGDDPYAAPLLPTPAVIKSVTRAAVVAFHRRAFSPEHAVLVVAGDIDRPRLVTAIGKQLGDWKAAAAPGAAAPKRDGKAKRKAKRRRAKKHEPPRLVFVDKPGAPQSVLRVGVRCPGRRSVHLAPMRALFQVLGGSFTSRLNQSLRENHGYTYGASASALLWRRAGLISVRTSVKTSVTVEAIVEIMRQLAAIRNAPVKPSEAATARRQLIDAMPARLETVSGLVDAQTTLALFELPLDADQQLAAAYAKTTSTEMQSVARARLRLADLTIVVVGDTSTFAKRLEKRYGPAVYFGPDGDALRRDGGKAKHGKPKRKR